MRAMLCTFFALGALGAPLAAQTQSPVQISVGPQVGAYVPVGDQRDELSDAVAVGAIARVDLGKWVGIVGNFWWSPSDATIASVSSRTETLDLFQYDLGLEVRPFASVGDDWVFSPFLAAGAGGRSLSFRDLNLDAQTDLSGFAAVGGEFGFDKVAVRLEARGYLIDFNGYKGTLPESVTRGDLTFQAGLMFRF